MKIPKSCGHCNYGNTVDISIDDLVTYCFMLDDRADWCDFPQRSDKTIRMRHCPLPNPTDEQIETGIRIRKLDKLKKECFKRYMVSKSYRIRKKNGRRLLKL